MPDLEPACRILGLSTLFAALAATILPGILGMAIALVKLLG